MLKAWYIQLKDSPPTDACQQDQRFIPTKKRGLTASRPFWYHGYFLSTEKQPLCFTVEVAQGICLAETGITYTEEWLPKQSVSKSEAGGQQLNSVLFISVSAHDPVFPHCGLGYANC